MVSELTLITPTGARPLAFHLCERWMRHQTYKGEIQWIVVDDGPTSTSCSMGQEVVRPEPLWRAGENTQRRNLLAAFPLVKHDHVVFIEDDDYYSPNYLTYMAQQLEDVAIVGEKNALYYHVVLRKWFENGNHHHASLCQTGMHSDYLYLLARSCQGGHKFVDIFLWSTIINLRKPFKLLDRSFSCIGIKGLPGRAGIGVGHTPNQNWRPDFDMAFLKLWIGNAAAEVYKPFFRGGAIGLSSNV